MTGGDIVKRRIIQLVGIAFAFLIVPQSIDAEGNDGKPSTLLGNLVDQQADLLEESIKETSDVVDVDDVTVSTSDIKQEVIETVDSTVLDASDLVNETINNLDKPEELVKQTTNVVGKAVGNTKSVVNTTSDTTTDVIKNTTYKISETVTKAVVNVNETVKDTTDEVLQEIPPIPVVAPIVKEVKKQTNKITDSIRSEVNQTAKPIEQVKTSIEDVVTKKETVAQMPTSSLDVEPVSSVENQDLTIETETVAIVSVVQDEKVIGDTSRFNTKPLKLNETTTVPEYVNSSRLRDRETLKKAWKVNQPVDSIVSTQYKNNAPKVISQNDHPEITFSSLPLISSSYSSTSSGGMSDGLMGVLLLDPHQIGLSKVWWNQGNKFALKQWIYDPLGQPPRFTPFLN